MSTNLLLIGAGALAFIQSVQYYGSSQPVQDTYGADPRALVNWRYVPHGLGLFVGPISVLVGAARMLNVL